MTTGPNVHVNVIMYGLDTIGGGPRPRCFVAKVTPVLEEEHLADVFLCHGECPVQFAEETVSTVHFKLAWYLLLEAL